jgi:hypothetical protein
MNPHTPKWIPILGIRVPLDFQIFREGFEGLKFIGLKHFLYHWKVLKTEISEMGSHDPFEYLQHKLWSKERSGIKVSI